MIQIGVVAHGGAGAPVELSDGCEEACQAAFSLLKEGGRALEAAVEAVRVLEDDGRFNAGCGSVLRLDGKTIEMDAAVMDSMGTLGAVISIRDVRNPVLVAREVTRTPHVALSGQGATAFARKRGFAPYHAISPRALELHEKVKKLIKEGRLGEEHMLWRDHDVRSLWNSEETSYPDLFPRDTVGAVAADKDGKMAVATSTGGASPMMVGRVGDTPIIGCGFYTGPACAVAVTGIGEEIIRRMLAKTVYDLVSHGKGIKDACEIVTASFPPEIPMGIIGISKAGYAVSSNRDMASHALTQAK